MALVDYISSDEEEEEEEVVDNKQVITQTTIAKNSTINLKRKRDNTTSDLPPLPSKFHDLYASTVRNSTTDDPSLHGGRKRVTPHVEGNWPTHVYIEWYPSATEYGILSTLISDISSSAAAKDSAEDLRIESLLTSDLGAPLPLHVSLSRSLGFSKDVKDTFLASLEEAIKISTIRPFQIVFSSLGWVPNYEKTRWFLVVRLLKPENDGLNKLLHVSNKVAEDFKQPPLYATPMRKYPTEPISRRNQTDRNNRRSKAHEPKQDFHNMQDLSKSFHISIAWTLVPPNEELIATTEHLMNSHLAKMKEIQVTIKDIKAKIGNIVTNIPLPKGATDAKGLFGF